MKLPKITDSLCFDMGITVQFFLHPLFITFNRTKQTDRILMQQAAMSQLHLVMHDTDNTLNLALASRAAQEITQSKPSDNLPQSILLSEKVT